MNESFEIICASEKNSQQENVRTKNWFLKQNQYKGHNVISSTILTAKMRTIKVKKDIYVFFIDFIRFRKRLPKFKLSRDDNKLWLWNLPEVTNCNCEIWHKWRKKESKHSTVCLFVFVFLNVSPKQHWHEWRKKNHG